MKFFLFVGVVILFIFIFCSCQVYNTAQASELVSVDFWYENSLLIEMKIPINSTLKVGLSYRDFLTLAKKVGYDLPVDGVVEWMDSNGQNIDFPLKVSSDINLHAKVNDNSDSVTIALISHYKSPLDYQITTIERRLGEELNLATTYNDVAILSYYKDPTLEEKFTLPKYATYSFTTYLLLDKNITFFINDKEYTCEYGCSFSSILDTDTHKVNKVFTDKERSKEYKYLPHDSEKYYVDIVRSNYRLTLVSESGESTYILLPVTNSEISLDENYRYYSDSILTNEIDRKLTLTDDMVVYLSTQGTARPNLIQDIFTLIASVVVISFLIWRYVDKEQKEKARRIQLAIVERSFYE